MQPLTRKTDKKARLTLPRDFADCFVTVEREGDTLTVRKARDRRRKYTFRELMAGVKPENIHAAISTGRPVGGEAL
jgi:antitoxin component of MazEF toxin-antitoxin module